LFEVGDIATRVIFSSHGLGERQENPTSVNEDAELAQDSLPVLRHGLAFNFPQRGVFTQLSRFGSDVCPLP